MKNTKEQALEVVSAAYDKKPIEMRGMDGKWHQMLECLQFDFDYNEYRVKPQPREWWEIEHEGLLWSYHRFDTEKTAREFAFSHCCNPNARKDFKFFHVQVID